MFKIAVLTFRMSFHIQIEFFVRFLQTFHKSGGARAEFCVILLGLSSGRRFLWFVCENPAIFNNMIIMRYLLLYFILIFMYVFLFFSMDWCWLQEEVEQEFLRFSKAEVEHTWLEAEETW